MGIGEGWPRYQSHKVVRAAEIIGIVQDGKTLVVKPGEDQEEISPTEPGMWRRAKLGDYAVVYDDGYTSVSPRGAFQDGYFLVTT